MTIQALSHIGLCVSDLASSERFYCEGLGFQRLHPLRVEGREAARLLGIEGVELEALYLERDGMRLELLHFAQPGQHTEAHPRPMNQCGLTHLSLRTDDLERDLATLERLGGRVLPETRVDHPGFQSHVAFLTDPDGTRIELVQMPGDPGQLPGAP